MKKLGVVSFILVFLFTGSSLLWAGGADNKTNWSAEYIGMLNRNAATDSADIVMYNPAGVMKMENGFHGNLSAHAFTKDYNNKIDGKNFDQDEPSIVPGLFSVYKKEKWAVSFGVSNVVGGGKVDFKDGNNTSYFVANKVLLSGALGPYNNIESQELKAEQMGLGFTLGGAYKINDMWSVSLGARYVNSTRKMDGKVVFDSAVAPGSVPVKLKFEEDDDGFGGVIGINFSPNDKLNIGLRYDTEIDLDYEADVKTASPEPLASAILAGFDIVDGEERSRNLPAMLGAGISYKFTPKLRIETNLTYYFNEDADFPDISGTTRDESAVDNGYDIGIGLDYSLTDKMNLTCGYLYTDTGVDDANDMTPENPELNAQTIGAGVRYKMSDSLKLTFSLGHVFYDSDSYTNVFGQDIKYEKEITFVGFGVEYKFF